MGKMKLNEHRRQRNQTGTILAFAQHMKQHSDQLHKTGPFFPNIVFSAEGTFISASVILHREILNTVKDH